MQSFAAAQHNHLKAFVQIVSVNYLWHSHKKHGTLALVVELLETRQAAQHCEAILAGVSSTTGILSQPEHSETCQWTQMRELGERGNQVPPQVELTQEQAASQGRERGDAVDTTEREREKGSTSRPGSIDHLR